MGLAARNVQPRERQRERERESVVKGAATVVLREKQRRLPRLCLVEEQIIGITAIMELGQVLA